jgi:hypothetical protein
LQSIGWMGGLLPSCATGDGKLAQGIKRAGRSGWGQITTEAIVCLSLANLLFLRSAEVLQDPSLEYFRLNATPASLIAFYFNILSVGACAWGGLVLAHRIRSKFWQKLCRIILLLIAFEGLKSVCVAFHFTGSQSAWSSKPHLLLRAAMLLVLAIALVGLTERIWQMVTAILLILAPLFPLEAFLTARNVLRSDTREMLADRPSPQPLRVDPRLGRVLILIFDEMDQRLTFLNHPADVKLPELERLRGESFYATAVHSPGAATLLAIPGMITGRPVSSADPRPNELMLTYEGTTEAVPWSAQPNLFSQARQLGANTGVVGWYHPYCRILGDNLTTCAAVGGQYPDGRFSDSVLDEYLSIDQQLTRVRHLDIGRDRSYTLRAYREMHDKALRLACDPRIQVAFLHWPTPHPPGIYSRITHQLTATEPADYFDNLELVDQTLGEMRRSMEAAGVWEQTAVILTADHNFRVQLWQDRYGPLPSELQTATGGESYPLVPFLVKLAGENHPITYDAPFSGLLLRDLALNLLQRKLKSPEDLAGWLDGNRSIMSAN